jgi:hypothetical protein
LLLASFFVPLASGYVRRLVFSINLPLIFSLVFHHMDDEEAAVLAVGSNRTIEGVNVVDKEK